MMKSAKARILLLQGPLGPFFGDLASFLSEEGAYVRHICFNRGDLHFSKARYREPYYGRAEDWRSFLFDYLQEHKINKICLYGDSRFYHSQARDVANELGIKALSLEEGYVRPGYVTAEWGGNNVNSPIRSLDAFEVDDAEPQLPNDVGPTFFLRMIYAAAYYYFRFFHGLRFLNYMHHRPGNGWGDFVKWVRSGWRYYTNQPHDHKIKDLLKDFKGRLFFVPLQVSVDSQIIHHSRFETMEGFIEEIIGGFSQYYTKGDLLLFKHHPMDRGYKNYAQIIKRLANKYAVEGHVHYCFDVDVSLIMEKARFCLTVNSGMGYQALMSGIAVRLYGPAFYDSLIEEQSFENFINDDCSKGRDAILSFDQCLKALSLQPGDFYKDRGIAVMAVAKLLLSEEC